MKTLTASTISIVVAKSKRPRYIRIVSDSTTLTRLALSEQGLDMAALGFGFTAYDEIVVFLPPGQDIYAVSTGTPNISYAEVRPDTVKNVINL